MVYYRTIPEIDNAFQRMVGLHDYLDPSHRPDGQRALELASLQPGQSVLEIGAGSGRLIADAKRAVGAGFCVAVDAVQGFLTIDIPWQLNHAGLTVPPQGAPQQQ
ncbi:UbiE Methylase, partial [Pyrenophora tritici-repentis]